MSKKLIGNILFVLCISLSFLVTYLAMNHAGALAQSGEEPSVLVGAAAFMLAVALVFVATLIKVRMK